MWLCDQKERIVSVRGRDFSFWFWKSPFEFQLDLVSRIPRPYPAKPSQAKPWKIHQKFQHSINREPVFVGANLHCPLELKMENWLGIAGYLLWDYRGDGLAKPLRSAEWGTVSCFTLWLWSSDRCLPEQCTGPCVHVEARLLRLSPLTLCLPLLAWQTLQMGIQHFSGLFVLLCLGVAGALLTLAGEHAFYRLVLPHIRRRQKFKYWLHTSQVNWGISGEIQTPPHIRLRIHLYWRSLWGFLGSQLPTLCMRARELLTHNALGSLWT